MIRFSFLALMMGVWVGCTAPQSVKTEELSGSVAPSVEAAEAYCKKRGQVAMFEVEKPNALRRRPPKAAKATWVLSDDAATLEPPSEVAGSPVRVVPKDEPKGVSFRCE
jgi:hypothetical protein